MIRLSLILSLAMAGPHPVSSPTQEGYSHRFTWKQKPDPEKLAACLQDMATVVTAAKRRAAGPDGTGKPILEGGKVEFNGAGADKQEPFVFPGEPGENTCTTDFKPYDAVVTACLLVARDHFSYEVLEITSDGDWGEEEWFEGVRLYRKALGRQPRNPMPVKRPVAGPPHEPGTLPLPAAASVALSLLFFVVVAIVVMKMRDGER